MARLWSCGFELNSLTDLVEVDDVVTGGGGLFEIVTSQIGYKVTA